MELPFGPGPVHGGTLLALVVEAAVKGTIVLVLVAVGMRILRWQTAAVRHWLLTCTAAGILAMPALTVLLPVWPMPIFPDTALWSYAVAKVGSPEVTNGERPVLPAAPVTATERERPAQAGAETRTWRGTLVLGWAAGASLFLLRLLVGTALARGIARRARPFDDARFRRMARALGRQIRLATPVRILRSAEIETPLTLGIVESVVILPFDADRWPEARLRVALLHELAHVKRHDCLAQLIADLACVFYWFHPVVWRTARRIRLERECACDDAVIRTGVKPSMYAEHLLQLATRLSSTATRFAIPMAQRSQLEARVHAILDPRVPRHGPSRAGFAVTLLAISALIMPLAALDPWTLPAGSTAAADWAPPRTIR